MATTTFEAMAYELSPFLPGCPSLTIEQTLRKYAADLCRWGQVWRDDMTQIALVAGTHEYAVSSPVVTGRFDQPLVAYTTIGTTKQFMRLRTYEQTLAEYPSWPGDADGTPVILTLRDQSTIMLAPVPDAVGTLDIYGTLVPVSTATGWDTAMYDEHRDVLFHGVLYELLGMPGRSWTDAAESKRHEQRWVYGRANARSLATRQYMHQSTTTQMIPFA